MASVPIVSHQAARLWRHRALASHSSAKPASAAASRLPRATASGENCISSASRARTDGTVADTRLISPMPATRMAASRTLHTADSARLRPPNARSRRSSTKPMTNGSQKASPRNDSVTTAAAPGATPSDVSARVMAPSTMPMPCGVGEMIQNSTATA